MPRRNGSPIPGPAGGASPVYSGPMWNQRQAQGDPRHGEERQPRESRILKSSGRSQFITRFRVLGLMFVSLTMIPGAAQLASAADSESDAKWANSVLQRLPTTRHARRPVSHFQSWPPTVEIVEVESNAELRERLGLYGQGLNPDFHFSFGSANHRVASDAFIYEGWKALKALRRSTPHG